MRIWVTGIGVVSPLGRGASVTMDRLVAGERAFAELTLFQPGEMRGRLAAEVRGLTAALVAPEGKAEGWSRTDAMAVLSVREALAQAGVDPRTAPVDLIVGGTTAGMFETEDTLAWLSREPSAITPLARMLSHPLSSTADHVHEVAGPFRRTRTLCSACSSGANALLLGAAWLRAGLSDCVVAGGADGLCRLTYAGFSALAAIDAQPCKPFDRRRAGLNLGEGAGFLVLEPEDKARARGAEPLAELRGWAVGAEAHHITNPERTGRAAARVMEAALARAGITPAELDYVNAHGTATPLNDAMEAAALHIALGPEVRRIPVSSSKGQIGHTLGASGGIEAAISVLAIARGVIPPTMGLEEVDPACDLVHVTESRSARLRAVMSSSFGFGGTDTVLVFAEPGHFAEPDAPVRRSLVMTGGATVGVLGVCASEGSGAYLDPGPAPPEGPLPFLAAEHLDLSRARRIDRSGRLATVAIQTALRESGLDLTAPGVAESTGVTGGASFGSVDASTAFMRRIYDKGAKYASPADFPNLVPSSPVAHASIYVGLHGPVFATADLGATAESTILSALELVQVGEADAMAAGSVEEASAMIERCLGPICTGIEHRGVRGEGASAVLVEAEERARARGARVLGRVVWWASWRGDRPEGLGDVPAPPASGEAWVLVGREDERVRALVAASSWAGRPHKQLAPRAGDHEGAGGFAVAAALSALASGAARSVLVVGSAPDRISALLLEAADDATDLRAP